MQLSPGRDLIIGIDAGTSLIKAVAFTTSGQQLGNVSLPNAYDTAAGDRVEQDMARTWRDTVAALRGLGAAVPDLAARVAAIAVTGQGDGTWLIDDDGRPVAPALLWLDSRAAAIVEGIRASERNAALYRRTGSGLNACQQGPQLAWLQTHAPEIVSRAATAFHCKDWLYFLLTGERATDPSETSFSCGNFREGGFDAETARLIGIADLKRLFPRVVDGATTTHQLNAAAAGETGLPAGLPVTLGYVDVICTALGAGLYDPAPDVGCTIIGSTGMHMRLAPSADAVALNPEATGYTMPFPVPGYYAQMQSNMAATLNIDWLVDLARDLLASEGVNRSRADLIRRLDENVLQARPCELLFHPFISDAGERGPFVAHEACAQFLGLRSRHGYWDLMRAVMEGLAFAARDCYAAMGSLPGEVRMTGGAARSSALGAILGAALGSRIRICSRGEAGAAGAAMMAAVATGLYPDMAACAEDWVTPYLNAPQAPDAALVARYGQMFPAYLNARLAARPVWKELATLRAGAGHV
ncbi:putative carbohydrate kinase (xylulose/erythritol kinase, lyx/eryA-like) [Bradyrhizobium sp. STM 3843]|uniref:FGGY-family carbohydrate kinase n=1 Tax=Bradyrhizobium sp. STM 3843 TaxID=551947 RepID=UPI000240A99F|nr:FGGY-family carbohydrate kinase [Bradyrhizobium sp. STM 3843]CCE05015.1 putative carbohydrate kinase (xylulose/erythritol kinase, lyx/eryA-like) [Bradyrhizobium sp. STM 3843]